MSWYALTGHEKNIFTWPLTDVNFTKSVLLLSLTPSIRTHVCKVNAESATTENEFPNVGQIATF